MFRMPGINYSEFVKLLNDRDESIEKAPKLLNFLLENIEHVNASVNDAQGLKLLKDRIDELKPADLGKTRTRKKLQELLKQVPALHIATADRILSIEGQDYLVHEQLLAAQDQALSDLLQDIADSDKLELGGSYSAAAQDAYVKALEHNEQPSPELHFEVLELASRDNNSSLSRRLWLQACDPEQPQLGSLLRARVHAGEKDPLGSYQTKLEGLKRRLPEGRGLHEPSKRELLLALINAEVGDGDALSPFIPDFMTGSFRGLSEADRKLGAWVAACTDAACFPKPTRPGAKELRKILYTRFAAEPPLTSPLVAEAKEHKASFYPCIVASYCERLQLVSLNEGEPAAWLSRDIEHYPLELQAQVLDALSGKTMKSLPAELDAWKLLDLAEMHGIPELATTVREQLQEKHSCEQLFNTCMNAASKTPLADFMTAACRLKIAGRAIPLAVKHCEGLATEQLGLELRSCLRALHRDYLGDLDVAKFFSAVCSSPVNGMPQLELVAQTLTQLEEKFSPEFCLRLIRETLRGSEAGAESKVDALIEDRYGEDFDPSNFSTEQRRTAILEVERLLKTARQEARKQVMAELAALATDSPTLQDLCEAYFTGVTVEDNVYRELRIKANSQRRPELALLERLQERFDCTCFYLDAVSWVDWQELDLSNYLQNADTIQVLFIGATEHVEPELYTELAKILPRISGLKSLFVHGPSDERGFYRERIDMDSLNMMLDAMLQNPSLTRIEVDARREEDHEQFGELLNGDARPPLRFQWGGGGASMIFDKR